MKKFTYENITHAKELNIYLEQGNRVLGALGYTDHSSKHTAKVAMTAGKLLKKLGYDDHTVELARIAGYMHDLGNSINRASHAQTGALMAISSCAAGEPLRKISPLSSLPSASTMNRTARPSIPSRQPSSWLIKATCAAAGCAIPSRKRLISMTGSIMPPCPRHCT